MNMKISHKLSQKLVKGIGKNEKVDDRKKYPLADLTRYYPKDLTKDIDFLMNDQYSLELALEDDDMRKNCYTVHGNELYIPPNSFQAGIAELYRDLVDFDGSLMRLDMKNDFYTFCAKFS